MKNNKLIYDNSEFVSSGIQGFPKCICSCTYAFKLSMIANGSISYVHTDRLDNVTFARKHTAESHGHSHRFIVNKHKLTIKVTNLTGKYMHLTFDTYADFVTACTLLFSEHMFKLFIL